MNRQNVTKWYYVFSSNRINGHEKDRANRPSVIFDKPSSRTEEEVRANRHLTMKELIKSYLKLLRCAISN